MTTHESEIHIKEEAADTTNCHLHLLGGRTYIAKSPDQQRASRAEEKECFCVGIADPPSSIFIFDSADFSRQFSGFSRSAYVYICYIHMLAK